MSSLARVFGRGAAYSRTLFAQRAALVTLRPRFQQSLLPAAFRAFSSTPSSTSSPPTWHETASPIPPPMDGHTVSAPAADVVSGDTTAAAGAASAAAPADGSLRDVHIDVPAGSNPLTPEEIERMMAQFDPEMDDEQKAQMLKNGVESKEYEEAMQQQLKAQEEAKLRIPPATESKSGNTTKMSFQTETRQILDIVAKSLYQDREVFLRELISNASDALEKLRYLKGANQSVATEREPEIHIVVDPTARTLTIQDTGVGMTKDELVSHLGTIARSGSKAFLKEMQEKDPSADARSIIGKFGVGFYSTFMVGNRVDVYSHSAVDPSQQHYWTSDGSGEYELSEASGVPTGTKIVVHLKEDAANFANSADVERIIQKYSNFIGFPIYLNGVRINTVTAIWTRSPKEVSDAEHTEFYKFISNAYDSPFYKLHFRTDSPIEIKAIFYVPERHSERAGMGRLEPGVSLYSRKVLIQPKCKSILPDWLRFVKGVVDSEDIPLNISRETMQDSALIARIKNVLVKKLIRFFDEQSRDDATRYNKFVAEYGDFLKEGAITDNTHKNDIAKLLRFESSAEEKLVSLDEYVSRMTASQKAIYYFVTTSRSAANHSPYLESFKKKGIEVLLMYQHLDDFVMRNLTEYSKRKLLSIESAEASASDDVKSPQESVSADTRATGEQMCSFFQEVLFDRVSSVTVSARLVNSPAIIVDHESAALRQIMKYVNSQAKDYIQKQKLEINPNHEIIQRLAKLHKSAPDVAKLVVEQVFDNAMISAGILDNPQNMLPRINKLLSHAMSATPTSSTSDSSSSSGSSPAQPESTSNESAPGAEAAKATA